MRLLLGLILAIMLVSCSDEKTIDNQRTDSKDDEVSEPVMVGGAFLIECGASNAAEAAIGCRTTSSSNSLLDLDTRAYFLDQEEMIMAEYIEEKSEDWEIIFPIPEIDLTSASFHLELIGEDGDASYIHTEKLSDFYPN